MNLLYPCLLYFEFCCILKYKILSKETWCTFRKNLQDVVQGDNSIGEEDRVVLNVGTPQVKQICAVIITGKTFYNSVLLLTCNEYSIETTIFCQKLLLNIFRFGQ